MMFPEDPSLYFDTLIRLSVIVEHWLCRRAIRYRIKRILCYLRQAEATEAFFTVPVLDEEGSSSRCYFLADWPYETPGIYRRRRSLYLTQVGGFLAQIEPRSSAASDLQRLHPDDGLSIPDLKRLLGALRPAYKEAVSRRHEYAYEKGEYATW
jgi:hypothetical protein